ncbi:polyprenyl glycosylphosphotransferase [Sphingomonas koreensis]|uniref:Polyprenyl glycosylphosphotransferase n=1 Tax=Sphingomonas koreensis TaxID=93064 RepID=A0A430G214_9SPHN|nr:polyprenyl glycosylphosphotransferase [Sphingomonas koreensis]
MNKRVLTNTERLPVAMPHRPMLQRIRYQLAGGVLFAVLAPWLLRMLVGADVGHVQLVLNTVVADVIGLMLGYYIYQSMAAYPGAHSSYFVLPAFCISYALVIMVLIVSRWDYDRLILILGFIGCNIWFYATSLLRQTRAPIRVGVVPFGDVKQLSNVPGLRCTRLRAPSLAEVATQQVITADLRTDLPDDWERFLADATLNGIAVVNAKQLYESVTGRVRVDHLWENSFGSLIPLNAYLKLKYVIDLITAALALVALLPFFLIIAIVIRVESPGSALFRQTRMGYGGRPFTVFKFRTMRCVERTPEDARDAAMTGDNDPRITRLGRFLRRTRIDELPQIMNILRGEMSWIGPRPEAEVLSEWYEQELPFYRYRHVVRPGITGWAQVNQGHVADVAEVFNKLQYDFYYIRHFGPWLDALIVVRTIATVITGFGSR